MSQSRAVLAAVGTGERTFAQIAVGAGRGEALASGSLTPVLRTLVEKRLLAVEGPLSTAADTRNRRYRVADSYRQMMSGLIGRLLQACS